jgi:hypothetical protein
MESSMQIWHLAGLIPPVAVGVFIPTMMKFYGIKIDAPATRRDATIVVVGIGPWLLSSGLFSGLVLLYNARYQQEISLLPVALIWGFAAPILAAASVMYFGRVFPTEKPGGSACPFLPH